MHIRSYCGQSELSLCPNLVCPSILSAQDAITNNHRLGAQTADIHFEFRRLRGLGVRMMGLWWGALGLQMLPLLCVYMVEGECQFQEDMMN